MTRRRMEDAYGAKDPNSLAADTEHDTVMVAATVNVARRARADGSQGEKRCNRRECGRDLVDDVFRVALDFDRRPPEVDCS
jgi:hypothetical protein